jgi:radical SAM-linked protein
VHFSKTDQMRFTSHLDLIKTWERIFRRADLPLSYSEGFNPRPLINIAAPLPLGYTSEGEIADFWLSEITPLQIFQEKISTAVPPGILVGSINEISNLHGEKLPTLVQACSYRITLPGSIPNLKDEITAVLTSDSLIRTRKNKEYDLRPLILELDLIDESNHHQQVLMKLTTIPGSHGRPDEVLSSMKITPEQTLICRTAIHLQHPEGK